MKCAKRPLILTITAIYLAVASAQPARAEPISATVWIALGFMALWGGGIGYAVGNSVGNQEAEDRHKQPPRVSEKKIGKKSDQILAEHGRESRAY